MFKLLMLTLSAQILPVRFYSDRTFPSGSYAQAVHMIFYYQPFHPRTYLARHIAVRIETVDQDQTPSEASTTSSPWDWDAIAELILAFPGVEGVAFLLTTHADAVRFVESQKDAMKELGDLVTIWHWKIQEPAYAMFGRVYGGSLHPEVVIEKLDLDAILNEEM